MSYQLYRFCRFIYRLGLRFFFRKIEIKGLDRMPTSGPVIIVANHAASFLDPIVIATRIKLRVFFLGKARALKRPLPTWFLRFFSVVPLYRAQDDPNLMDRNQKSFSECFKHLEKKGTLIIFPEGISHSVRQLLKIKTGAARIALGAEARNKFELGVKIVAFGLNYSNQEKFQSKLFISIGEPIEVSPYKDAYQENEIDTVNKLTQDIEAAINSCIINAGDERKDALINRIERLVKAKILKDWGVKKEMLEMDHKLTKRIMKAMDFFLQKDPGRFADLEREINEYFERVKDVDLPETIFRSKKLTSGSVLRYSLYFLLGLPFSLVGLVGNFFPYKFSILSARGWSRHKEYRGAAGFVAGMLFFGFTYFLEFRLLLEFSQVLWIAILGTTCMPFLGVFTFYYWRKLSRFYYKWVFSFAKKQIFVRRLMARRNYILEELEKARQEFIAEEAAIRT